MGLKAGIVGLPNVGKSTLFNAITKQSILAANYPFATIEPNVGVVVVPDQRLDFLVGLYNPKSIVPTAYEFIDIAGLVKGASNGEGLGNKFLSHIRETDAIVEVVRCFENSDITHVEGNVDPIRDVEIINVELVLSDLEILTNRLNKLGKKVTMTKDKNELMEINTIKKCIEALEINKPLRLVEFDENELKVLKNFALITLKPIIYVANISEEEIELGKNEYTDKLMKYASEEGSSVITMCAKIEEELAPLSDEEREMFMLDLGIKSSGLDRLIFATYDILGLKTFFTSGTDECRAWTFKNGMKAPECAGLIHSDIERGFIRAEVMSYTDLREYGSDLRVKEAGKTRLEGKEYLMQDGDIVYFRFNV